MKAEAQRGSIRLHLGHEVGLAFTSGSYIYRVRALPHKTHDKLHSDLYACVHTQG